MDNADIINRFTYHPAKEDQVPRYVLLRSHAFDLAQTINTSCPDSREKSLALTALEESVMWAISAIARNEPEI